MASRSGIRGAIVSTREELLAKLESLRRDRELYVTAEARRAFIARRIDPVLDELLDLDELQPQ